MKVNLLKILLWIFLLISAVTAQTQAASNAELILEKGVAPHPKIDDVYRRFARVEHDVDAPSQVLDHMCGTCRTRTREEVGTRRSNREIGGGDQRVRDRVSGYAHGDRVERCCDFRWNRVRAGKHQRQGTGPETRGQPFDNGWDVRYELVAVGESAI